jgi:hypothetical protein
VHDLHKFAQKGLAEPIAGSSTAAILSECADGGNGFVYSGWPSAPLVHDLHKFAQIRTKHSFVVRWQNEAQEIGHC